MGGHERSGVQANWADDDYFTLVLAAYPGMK